MHAGSQAERRFLAGPIVPSTARGLIYLERARNLRPPEFAAAVMTLIVRITG